MDGRANPLMARKVIGAVSFGVVALVTSPNTAGCGVVKWSCSCRVVVVVVVGVVVSCSVV